MADANQSVRELVIKRTFAAPRELVFRLWTDPKLVAKWWGPRGTTIPTCEIDAKNGGEMYIVMLAGKELGDLAGQKWPMKGTFEEVVPPSKVSYVSWAIENEKGEWLLENKVKVTLQEAGKNTVMKIVISVTKAAPGTEGALAGMEMGWNQQIDKLGEEIASWKK